MREAFLPHYVFPLPSFALHGCLKRDGVGNQANSEGKYVHVALHTLEVCPAQNISDDGAAKVRERREDKRVAGGETIGEGL